MFRKMHSPKHSYRFNPQAVLSVAPVSFQSPHPQTLPQPSPAKVSSVPLHHPVVSSDPTTAVKQAIEMKDNPAPLLVLGFVTSNCRACAYASRAFSRLAQEFSLHPQQTTSDVIHGARRPVKFLTIDISQRQNQPLGIRLGVNAVPAFHTYVVLPSSSSPDVSLNQSPDNFAVLDQHVGARVVGRLRNRLLHYISPDFNLNDYVFHNRS